MGRKLGRRKTPDELGVMMELSHLRSVYEHEGPFATVYLEGRTPGSDSAEQMRLRWRALRERLESESTPRAVLDLIEADLVRGEAGEQHADGRVLVATQSEIVLDQPWDAALGAGDNAYWTTLPVLGAYAREAARSVRQLVVIADQQGAQVRQEIIAEQHEPREVDAEVVEGGGSGGVHKPRGGALSHNTIQRRADETVLRNAKDIVEHVRGVAARFRPRQVVLAGEVQARAAIRGELSADIEHLVVETDRGARDESSDTALTDELLRLANSDSAAVAERCADRLQSGLAHNQAVQGGAAVAKAAELGAVETLLFEHGVEAARESFLLKTTALTDSSFELVTEGTEMLDGVGALLRFPVP